MAAAYTVQEFVQHQDAAATPYGHYRKHLIPTDVYKIIKPELWSMEGWHHLSDEI